MATTKLTLFHPIRYSFGSLHSFRSSFIKNAHNLASLGADAEKTFQEEVLRSNEALAQLCTNKGEKEASCRRPIFKNGTSARV